MHTKATQQGKKYTWYVTQDTHTFALPSILIESTRFSAKISRRFVPSTYSDEKKNSVSSARSLNFSIHLFLYLKFFCSRNSCCVIFIQSKSLYSLCAATPKNQHMNELQLQLWYFRATKLFIIHYTYIIRLTVLRAPRRAPWHSEDVLLSSTSNELSTTCGKHQPIHREEKKYCHRH